VGKVLFLLFGFIAIIGAGIFFGNKYLKPASPQTATPVFYLPPSPSPTPTPVAKAYLTNEDLLKLADNKYQNGVVPLGDNKYVTSGPKKGYVYLCNVNKETGAGAGTDGPWISGGSWNFLNKISVSGNVSWPNATFVSSVTGTNRVITGNDLPITHTTGLFPIASNDQAYQYDRNPNSISAQNINVTIPANPTYSNTPYCMGGEVGIMNSGVALFNSFDAELRDAPAHELQDKCGGHPQKTGEYHYHGMSNCFTDINVATVLGFAYDGFPITGPMVAKDKYLTTEDLDECHGITSEIKLNGVSTVTYHYVMTQDFPYSVSCFRGKYSQQQKSGSPPQPPAFDKHPLY